jgi:integrase
MQAEKSARLTDRKALALPPPDKGYVVHWCPQTTGFGVRITSAGGRSWVTERRLNGRTVRRTLGRAAGRGAISGDAARKLMLEVHGDLQRGIDRMEVQRAERVEREREKTQSALTLTQALKEYVTRKRRGKDGLPLKERTRADYLAMIEPAEGRKQLDGELHELAETSIYRITAEDIRRVYRRAAARGTRRGSYAMQVLRAVLNWHGIQVPGNPLGRNIAGKERIVLGATAGDPNPIPPERLAAWWNAATQRAGGAAADYYRFILLTGARPGEVASITAKSVDEKGARITLTDTKNRTDHVLLLSTEAAAIVAKHVKGKKAATKLFAIGDGRKTLAAINLAAGTRVTPHDLRSTFASVAEDLVSAYTLKRMLNHANSADVTGGHYVKKSETQLRAGWQAVADFIVKAAKE